MLDTTTKRRIDTARDILVGKVPDPKSQVEQITVALIYKFMDDMDAEAEELGGNRKFFAGDFARYGWPKLIRSGLGGYETLNLYAEAIAKMPENPGIPPLFRDIFKNAFLPYRDPETLRSFLKIIDEFEYDHSERLGDAFEYLLSVLGSQGDAGQFRTPRHIIDFIVSIIDPKKNETILDPACGTAGFLISSYKHILKANSTPAEIQTGPTSPEPDAALDSSRIPPASGNLLTPDERGQLAANFKGFDISPDMVRLSLVNMYLHGFPDPHIFEYDTLTSLDHWNEYADVILANPPFMSPKGGIKPHNRFSVQSKRSEVLFVDYIADHLKPGGRAGIIVPEGIIFQSQNAYKQLRKKLLDEALVAVISMPAGVFNPYAGVKTSILILDKQLARPTNTIAFFKVENDGFGLGAQRRPINKNDLPQVQKELNEYLGRLRKREPLDDFQPAMGLIVQKDKITDNGDYNLSGERYRDNTILNSSFPLIALGDSSLFRVESGGTPQTSIDEYWNGGIPWVTLADLPATNYISRITTTQRTISDKGLRVSSAKLIPAYSVIVSTRATIGRIGINLVPLATNQGFKNIVIENPDRVTHEYVALAVTQLVPQMKRKATGGTFSEISKSKFCDLRIPLPPLDIQKEIVAEIEGYQKVIDGARAVIDNYKPHIPIDPEWPMVELGEVCEIKGGKRLPKGTHFSESKTSHPYIRVSDFHAQSVFINDVKYISNDVFRTISRYTISSEDVYISIAGTIGLIGTIPRELNGANLTENAAKLSLDKTRIDKQFLSIIGIGGQVQSQIRSMTHTVGVPKLALERIKKLIIPLPPLEEQRLIANELGNEKSLVNSNKELITRMENKIQELINRVYSV